MEQEFVSDKNINGENLDSSRRLTNMANKTDLPRERAIKYGFNSLSDTEIMAILLGTGTKGKNVLDLSSEILYNINGHLSELSRMNVKELTAKYSGIGQGKALTVLAAVELGRRAAMDAAQLQNARKAVTSSSVAFDLMKSKLQNIDHEQFWVLLLNNGLKRITEVCISQGAVNYTIVEVKKIIKTMIDNSSNNVMLFHNHPSGSLKPSVQDDNLTRKIVEAAKLFDFKVIDHIIVTDGGYYSYNDSGRL